MSHMVSQIKPAPCIFTVSHVNDFVLGQFFQGGVCKEQAKYGEMVSNTLCVLVIVVFPW